MRGFIRRNLEPADCLGEVLFGLIMALGFTTAVRLGHEEADSRALFIAILGCNLAWAIVDGVTHVLTVHFERGRLRRLAREVAASATDAEALRCIVVELQSRLGNLTTRAENEEIARHTLKRVRGHKVEPPRLRWEDFSGGIALALLLMIATLPVVIPFLIVADPHLAVRISNLVALTELFLLGLWWGWMVDERPWRIALGLTLVGVVLVLISVALGG